MIVKILGILDVFIAILFLIFSVFNVQSISSFIFLLGLFLLAKGVVFMTQLSIASILDIISSIFIIVGSSIDLSAIIVVLVSLFLVQKGIFSLIA